MLCCFWRRPWPMFDRDSRQRRQLHVAEAKEDENVSRLTWRRAASQLLQLFLQRSIIIFILNTFFYCYYYYYGHQQTTSDVHWRCFYFRLTCVHSALQLSGWCTLQIYLLTHLLLLLLLLLLLPPPPWATLLSPLPLLLLLYIFQHSFCYVQTLSILSGPEVSVRLASRWNSLMMMMMILLYEVNNFELTFWTIVNDDDFVIWSK